MATSTAPISATDIVGVITTLQAAGVTITAAGVYREMHRREMSCRRSTVQAVVRAWHQQPREAADVAPCPVAPTPPPPRPVPHLLAVSQRIAPRAQALEATRRGVFQLEEAQAQDIADYRNGRRTAAEVTRLYLQGYQARDHPTYLMDPDMPRRLAQLRHELVALVGEEAVERLETDPSYSPWWLEG